MEFQIFSEHRFKLPNCTYTCSTLKILRLSGVIVKPINTRCIFPNVTSLVFDYVCFCDENLSDCGVNVPMLENLSFEKCTKMFCFNITAPRLQSLSVTDPGNNKLGSFLPVNLDFKSISTLSLNDDCLKDFAIQVTGRGEQIQPATLNVEHMNLSGFKPSSSSFACLLQMCPRLYKLQIYSQSYGHPALCFPELKLLEELDAVAQTCKLLHVLKFCFNGLGPEMHFIRTLLASFPTLEKVFIIRYKQYRNNFTLKEEFKIMNELLRFPRASKKAEIVYTSCNSHM